MTTPFRDPVEMLQAENDRLRKRLQTYESPRAAMWRTVWRMTLLILAYAALSPKARQLFNTPSDLSCAAGVGIGLVLFIGALVFTGYTFLELRRIFSDNPND